MSSRWTRSLRLALIPLGLTMIVIGAKNNVGLLTGGTVLMTLGIAAIFQRPNPNRDAAGNGEATPQ